MAEPLRGSPEWHAAQREACRRDTEAWCKAFDRALEEASAAWKFRQALRGCE